MSTLEVIKFDKNITKFKLKYNKIITYFMRNYFESITNKHCPTTLLLMILKMAYIIDIYFDYMCSIRVDIYIDKKFYSDSWMQYDKQNQEIMNSVKKTLIKIDEWPCDFIEKNIKKKFIDFLTLISSNTKEIQLAANIVWFMFQLEKQYKCENDDNQSFLMKYDIHQQLFKFLNTKWKYNCEIAINVWAIFSLIMSKNRKFRGILLAMGIISLLNNQTTKICNVWSINKNNYHSIMQLLQLLSLNLYYIITSIKYSDDIDILYNSSHIIFDVWFSLYTKGEQIKHHFKSSKKDNQVIQTTIKYHFRNLINCLIRLYLTTDLSTNIHLLLNKSPREQNIDKPIIAQLMYNLQNHNNNNNNNNKDDLIFRLLFHISNLSISSLTGSALFKDCITKYNLIEILIIRFKQIRIDSSQAESCIDMLANIFNEDFKNILKSKILKNDQLIEFLVNNFINDKAKYATLKAITNLMYLKVDPINCKLLTFNDHAFIVQVIDDLNTFRSIKTFNKKEDLDSLRNVTRDFYQRKQHFDQLRVYMECIEAVVYFLTRENNIYSADKYSKQLIIKTLKHHKIGQKLKNIGFIDEQQNVDNQYMQSIDMNEFIDVVKYFCSFKSMFLFDINDLVPDISDC